MPFPVQAVVPVTQVDALGVAVASSNPVPYGATAINATSGNVANASAVATLAAAAAKTTNIIGFDITGSGATAGLPVVVTVAGLLGGSITFTYTFAIGATVGNTPLIIIFPFPLPASAVNTAITVTCAASGVGGTNNVANAYGYQV